MFCGVGKSGYIAQLLAGIFTPVGISSSALDPAAARWGELAAVTPSHTVFLLSKSGTSYEIMQLVPFLKAKGAKVVSVTCSAGNLLSNMCDVNIVLPMKRELCPFNLSPTSSPGLHLLFAEICKVVLLRRFSAPLSTFACNYPSALHGRRVVLKISDIMLQLSDLATVSVSSTCMEALVQLNKFGHGFVAITDKTGIDTSERLIGVFTDGDLRRTVQAHQYNALDMQLDGLMTREPKFVHVDDLACFALEVMDAYGISFVFVVGADMLLLGAVTRHQILDANLV